MGDRAKIIGFVEFLAKQIQKDFPNLGHGVKENLFFPNELIPKLIEQKPEKYGDIENSKVFESAIRIALKGTDNFDGLIEDDYEDIQKRLQKKKYWKTGISKLSKEDNQKFALSGNIKKVRDNGTLWTTEDIKYLGVLAGSDFCLNKDGRINYNHLFDNVNYSRPQGFERSREAIQCAVQEYFPQFIKNNENKVDWSQKVNIGDLEEMSLREYAHTLSQRDFYKLSGGRVDRQKLTAKLNRISGLDIQGQITPEMTASELRRSYKNDGVKVDFRWTKEDLEYLGVCVRSGFCKSNRGLDYDVIQKYINDSRPKGFERPRSSIECKIRECFESEIKKKQNKVNWNQEVEVEDTNMTLIEYANHLSSLSLYQTSQGAQDRAKIAEELNRVAVGVTGEISKEMFARALSHYKKTRVSTSQRYAA